MKQKGNKTNFLVVHMSSQQTLKVDLPLLLKMFHQHAAVTYDDADLTFLTCFPALHTFFYLALPGFPEGSGDISLVAQNITIAIKEILTEYMRSAIIVILGMRRMKHFISGMCHVKLCLFSGGGKKSLYPKISGKGFFPNRCQ